jgi:hypothetical protein
LTLRDEIRVAIDGAAPGAEVVNWRHVEIEIKEKGQSVAWLGDGRRVAIRRQLTAALITEGK